VHGEEGFEASLMVQPIWLEVVRWELPSVMGEVGLIGTMAGKSSKIEARSSAIQGGVGQVARQLCDGASDATNRAMATPPCLF